MALHSTGAARGEGGVTRRRLLADGARGLLAWGCLPPLFGCHQRQRATGTQDPVASSASQNGERKYLAAAIRTGRWLESCEIRTNDGIVWPVDPTHPDVVETNLYHGTAGVVLFFLELHRASSDSRYLHVALSGADALRARLPSRPPLEPGLYTGVAGVGFALEEVYRASRRPEYRAAAERCIELLRASARQAGQGVEWNKTTDIISGSAGIGLFLLYALRQTGRPECRELALRAGHRLLELGRPQESGLYWAMDPTFPRIMPNFSHGTAGICYFLATLYQETKERRFLDSALAGARHVCSIARTERDTCLIPHHQPGGENLFYLGWCHGPPGTGRLFYRLWRVTRDSQWLSWVHKSARGVMQSGIPEQPTPGFWNNVGQCCGCAGVAEFFLNLHRVTGKPEYLQFCRRVTADLLRRAEPAGGGLRWVQAERRVRPAELAAQTGYMQGAAGIGMLLLCLDAFEQGRTPMITFPDAPFDVA